MYNVGDMVVVKAAVVQECSPIVGKAVEVVELHGDNHPYWITVSYRGEEYPARGTDCAPMIPSKVASCG